MTRTWSKSDLIGAAKAFDQSAHNGDRRDYASKRKLAFDARKFARSK